MITAYAVSLSCIDSAPGDFGRLVDLVDDWLTATFPYDPDNGFAAGVSVSSRHEPDNGVYRVTVTDSTTHKSRVDNTTVTVVDRSDSSGQHSLSFDVRIVAMPTSNRIAPHARARVSPGVLDLVRRAVAAVEFRDAETRVVDAVGRLTTEIEGQSLAGLAAYTGARRLPVIVEFPRESGESVLDDTGSLVGLAHLVRLDSADARRGYVELIGTSSAGPGDVVVHWAGGAPEETLRLGHLGIDAARREMSRVAAVVTDAATRSLAPPRVPSPDIDDDDDDPDEDSSASDVLRAQVAELQAALESADAIIEEQRERLSVRDDQVDQLVLRMTNQQLAQSDQAPVQVRTMSDVIDKARRYCSFLHLHPRAVESALALQGPDPNLVLIDLIRLNRVATRWAAGEFAGSSIGIECKKAGLMWASGISQNARQKYGEDYTIEWRGRSVLAAGHVRRGKKSALYRIYVYFDPDTREVVVAWIGRHLRDKGTH